MQFSPVFKELNADTLGGLSCDEMGWRGLKLFGHENALRPRSA